MQIKGGILVYFRKVYCQFYYVHNRIYKGYKVQKNVFRNPVPPKMGLEVSNFFHITLYE